MGLLLLYGHEASSVSNLTRRSDVPVTDSGGSTSATVTVDRPSDAGSGDLMVALIATTNGAAETITPDTSGWTQRIDTGNNSFVSTTAGGQNIAIFTRVLTGADPSSWTFTIGDSSNQWIACAIAWADSDTPIFDGGVEGEDTSGPASTTSSYTPTVDDCEVVSFFASDDNQAITWTPTTPSGAGNTVTELADHIESGNQLTVSVNVETQTTATATTQTATKSAGTRGSAFYLFAIQPNGAAPAPPPPAATLRFILEAAFGQSPDAASYTWTQIHDSADPFDGYLGGASWGRGRQNQLAQMETGTGSINLETSGREWDPQNAASPFYPDVRPMLPFRGRFVLDDVVHRMFLHYADGFPRVRLGPGQSEVTVPTVDGMEALALARVPPEKATLTVTQTGNNNDLVFTAKQPGPDGNNITVAFFETHFRPLRQQRVVITVSGTNIRVDYIDDGTVQVDEVLTALQANVAVMLLVDVENAFDNDGSGDMHPYPETHLSGGDTSSFPAELGGARFNRLLDLAGWPEGLRAISTGQDTHAAIEFPTSEDGKVLGHLQDISGVCSENGLFYINGLGNLVFKDRVDKLTENNTSVATFSDQSADGVFPYVSIVPNESKDLIVNDGVCTRDGGDPQLASDADSITTYRRRSRSFTTTLNTDLAVAAAVQAAVVEMAQPLQRVESVTLQPGDDSDYWQAVLTIDIGSRVTIIENPPGGGDPNEGDYIVQGLRWNVPKGPLHQATVTYNLWPADPISNWMIADDPVRGLADAGNRAGR